MGNKFYNRGANFNPDELADGDAIEAEFDAVSRGFDTIEDLMDANKAGYPTQTFHVATATEGTHAVPKAQMEAAIELVNYTATDVLEKLNTVGGSGSWLDADLLDGKHGSYYLDVTNFNAGKLAKERLPTSIDASTTGNAATATQITATAAAGATADLVKGAMGTNDYFRIRVGGNADDGWTEIATADNGDEPIYIRQYTGDFASIARTLTLLDASGNSTFPGNVRAATGGFTVKDTYCGMYPGNGDSASSTINNLKFTSWYGIGFGPTITGQSVPYGEYSHWFNTRNGDMGVRGTITAPQLNGNASTATTLQNDRTINGVSFNGSANITADPYVEQDTGTNATRYLTFVDSSTAGYKRLNIDSDLSYNQSTNTINTSISGNAATSTKLVTARTISLSGDATGSASFDGSANASITVALSYAGVGAYSAALAAGAIGTVALARKANATDVEFGGTFSGSSLNPVCIGSDGSHLPSSLTLSGTWRCLGYCAGSSSASRATLWLRIY